MVQEDRTKLFNEAYRLDNLSRLWVPKKDRDGLKVITAERLERLRMKDSTDDLCVLFTEAELARVSEFLRELAANDESRFYDRKRQHR